MSLAQFPITKRFPPTHPDRLQLYSLPTPNGVKVSIMLEEIGLPYEVHKIDFAKGDQKTDEYKALNPNAKIPAIIDPAGPDGPLPLFESAAILHFLADLSEHRTDAADLEAQPLQHVPAVRGRQQLAGLVGEVVQDRG